MMRLLDLFCGAGGAGMGYHLAGFEVVGVDKVTQPRYPFEFHQADALAFVRAHGHEFDVIHASPPCQFYSVTASMSRREHVDLVDVTREALVATGKPFVIENVPGAPLENYLILCGSMFGLGVIRHRWFECRPPIWFPPATCQCKHGGATGAGSRRMGLGRTVSAKLDGLRFVTVCGNDYLADEGRAAMGIDWMTKAELSQAIPPAYTAWLGRKIMKFMEADNEQQ